MTYGDGHLPHRYSAYLDLLPAAGHEGFDTKRALELAGHVRKGCVRPENLEYDALPSAPLRAFSYTTAGGRSSIGDSPNAIFKCPDGYTGSYSAYKCARHCNPEDNYRIPRDGGYDDWEYFDGNPFSNKIILMDEARRRALSTVTEWLGEVEPKTE
jgi:hypothetical protein